MFRYLAAHPEICASSLKETYFFLEQDHHRPAKYRFADGLDKYDLYFRHCPRDSIRLEATPHYLYSPSTPYMLKTSLLNVKLIFILREPIERLVSMYRFSKQLNTLPAPLDNFEKYVLFQFEHLETAPMCPPRALWYGRYATHLKNYFDVLGQDRICVLKFAMLKRDPVALLEQVCRFADVDSSFYQDYQFSVVNRSLTVKNKGMHNVYSQTRSKVRDRVHQNPRLYSVLTFFWRKMIKPFYLSMNQATDEQVQIPDALRTRLEDYYGDQPSALARLLGEDGFSWDV